ncbi:hypothetical protein MCOR08_008912 [Pyricularia oryzae]|nr:hypothetical protein MCOR08_008912 [Pyricularia oryzae]
MNVLSAVSEQLQGPISATTLPACCQAAGVRGTGACATWSANKTSHKRLAQASEDQLLGVKLGRIFAASGFRIADLEVQSSDRSLVKSSTQPRTALSSCPATPMERTPRGVVQKTTKNPRSRSDVDGPHTAEVPKKRRRLSWNQTTSPLSEPSSTPWSIKLSASATAGRSETGPDGWKQARLSQGALARRQIFLMGMHRQRAEVQEADGQIVERMKRGNNEMSRTEEFRAIDADPQTDAVGMESLGAPDVGSSQISTETAGGINSSGGVKCGTRQLRQCVNTNVSALHTEKPSDRTPSQSRAVRDPAAHLAAARAQITSRPFMSSTRPVPVSGQSRSPLVIFRPGQPLANMQMTSWVIPLPPFCSSTGTATPQSSLASTKEEIDSGEKEEEEEEDENELAFPTFKYESRYFANDCEDDGMEIYADLAGLWPQSGDGFPADMDAEYEEMGTFGISTFG